MSLLHRPFRRVGILNRGEPAVRFVRAARAFRLRRGEPLDVVALYTSSDRDALFVHEADDAIAIGDALVPGPEGKLRSAYLDVRRLLGLMQAAGCDAVWPGWGFASENPELADQCTAAGMVFIGPSGDAMRMLGDKIAAKRLAEQHGVPVTDWSRGPVASIADARAHAARIGYPVLLKATAGGGGRGIRIAHTPDELDEGFVSASNEARSAFGDPTLLVEKFVAEARHVEVQVLADSHGNVLALGTRDCSMQRRHQKVIEEAPAPFLSADLERLLCDSAVRVARACGYVNAGTAEFLVFPDGSGCAFLEMNTRLQVEHPVTECVTGIDLVGAQIDVARGDRLPEQPPKTRGHAVEARLCAEDPDDRFAPSAGKLLRFDVPQGPGIRVDSGFASGSVIPGEFDSMLAKVIATGETRDEAFARLRDALERFTVAIEGGASNRSLLLELMGHDTVRTSPVTTRWLDRHLADRPAAQQRRLLDAALIAAAVSEHVSARRGDVLNFIRDAQRGLPSSTPPAEPRSLRFRVGRHGATLDIAAIGPLRYRVACCSKAIEARFEFTGKSTGLLTYRGRRHAVVLVATPSAIHVEVDGVAHRLTRSSDGRVAAPVPAAVTYLHVRPGDVVRPGDRLVTLEVMKMEVAVEAPLGGQVAKLFVDVASRVAAGDALLTIEAATDGPSTEAVLCPFDDVPEAVPVDRLGDMVAVLRGAVLGYEMPRDLVDRAVAALREGKAQVSREALFTIVEAYVAREALFDRRPGPDGVAPIEHFTSYARLPRARGDGLPVQFLTRLRRALAFYEIHDLTPGPVLESALLRIYQAHRTRESRNALWLTLLASLAREDGDVQPAPSERHRDLLETYAAQVMSRNWRLADAAWRALFLLCDRPRQLDEARALADAAREAVEHLSSAPEGSADRQAARDVLDTLPHGAMLSLAGNSVARPPRERSALVDLHIERLYPHARRIAVAADAALFLDDDRQILGLLATAQNIDRRVSQALAELAAIIDERLPLDVDAIVAEADQQAIASIEADLPARLARIMPPFARRFSLMWGNVEWGRLGRTYDRADQGFVENVFFRDLHPSRVENRELARFSGFDLERMAGTFELVLVHARAKEDPTDERLFCIGEIERIDIERGADGLARRVPSFERVYLFAIHTLREELARRGRDAKLVWNRLVLFVRPVVSLARREIEAIGRRLAAFTAGLGLEKFVLHMRLRTPEGDVRPVAMEWANPTGSGVVITVGEPKTTPLLVLGAYERRVVEARRRGLFYPYELVRALAGNATNAPFPPGSFAELDLDESGERLAPVTRPYGANTANLVVGLIENRFAPYDDGLCRVLIVGDPTRAMGSLAEPECRRIIAAFDLAEQQRLPVEWVPISSGAKIAMDSGTENLDYTARVLARIVSFTEAGGTVNIIVDGVCVGAQSYFNAEATMLMHCKGTLVMTPHGSMLLTGKNALEFAGSVAAEDNLGIGGFERIMGPNGEAQYFAPDLVSAYRLLFRHYRYTHVQPGDRSPRRLPTADHPGRDITLAPYTVPDEGYTTVGEIFDEATNPGRKRPFSIRPLMNAVLDGDQPPLERWAHWQGAESAVVLEGSVDGVPVTCIGIESKPLRRRGELRPDGPEQWTSGTLFPLSSKKVARALSTASGVRPAVVLANLSGFDGSPDSLRNLQLEYGAEIGRMVVRFEGPLIFCVISRYHGGAYVVFSRALNGNVEALALSGSYASVIGGAPAAAVVFTGMVRKRALADQRVAEAKARLDQARGPARTAATLAYDQALREATAQAQAAVAREFDAIHTVDRALEVGSLQAVISPRELRPYLARRLSGRATPPPSVLPPPLA